LFALSWNHQIKTGGASMNNKKQVKRFGVRDPNFVYIPAANTDVLKRFRALGWVPPSELKNKDKQL
jgi:hypothetical protein